MILLVKVYHLLVGGEDEDQDVSQRIEVDATLPLPVGSISVKISPVVTLGGDRVAALDVE